MHQATVILSSFVVEQASERTVKVSQPIGDLCYFTSLPSFRGQDACPRHCTKKVEWGGTEAPAVAVIDGDAVIRHGM